MSSERPDLDLLKRSDSVDPVEDSPQPYGGPPISTGAESFTADSVFAILSKKRSAEARTTVVRNFQGDLQVRSHSTTGNLDDVSSIVQQVKVEVLPKRKQKVARVGFLGGMGVDAGDLFVSLYDKKMRDAIKHLPPVVKSIFEDFLPTHGVDITRPDKIVISQVMPRKDKLKEKVVGAEDPSFDMAMAITHLASRSDIIAVPCNTFQLYADELRAAHPGVKMLDIIEETVASIAPDTTVGLISTKATRDGGLYQKGCGGKNVRVITLPDEPFDGDPKKQERAAKGLPPRSLQEMAANLIDAAKEGLWEAESGSVHEATDTLKSALGMLKAVGKGDASTALLQLAQRLLQEELVESVSRSDPRAAAYEDMSVIMGWFKSQGAEAVIQGCTEFPLFREQNYQKFGMKMISSTEALADAVVDTVITRYIQRADELEASRRGLSSLFL